MTRRVARRLAVCLVVGVASSLGASWGFKFLYIVKGSAPTTFSCVDDSGSWHVSHWRAIGRRSYTLSAAMPRYVATTAHVRTLVLNLPRAQAGQAAGRWVIGASGVQGNVHFGPSMIVVEPRDLAGRTLEISRADPIRRPSTDLLVTAGELQAAIRSKAATTATFRITVPPSSQNSGALPSWVRRPPPDSKMTQLATGAYGWPLPCLKGELEVYPAPAPGGKREVYPCSLVISLDWSPRGMKFTMPRRILWHGLAIDSLAHGAIWATPLVFYPALRSRRWRRKGRCPGCGYELHGILARGCPECGWRVAESSGGAGAPARP